MKQRVIIIHGFNVRDKGSATTGRLATLLRFRGYEVLTFSTGWRGLLGVRLGNKRRAQQLAAMVRPGDWLIGHSDGNNLIDQALHELSSLDAGRVNCVYFNPALDKDTALAAIVSRCLVFHTPSDRVVWLSKMLRFHPWGEMGRTGYRAADESLHDPRYTNISYESLGFSDLGHSGVFKKIPSVRACLDQIEQHLNRAPAID